MSHYLSYLFLAEFDWGGGIAFLIVVGIGIISTLIQSFKNAQQVDAPPKKDNGPAPSPIHKQKPLNPQSLGQPVQVPPRPSTAPQPVKRIEVPIPQQSVPQPQSVTFETHAPRQTQSTQSRQAQVTQPYKQTEPTPPHHPTTPESHVSEDAYKKAQAQYQKELERGSIDLDTYGKFEFPEMPNLESMMNTQSLEQTQSHSLDNYQKSMESFLDQANKSLMSSVEERAKASMQKAKSQLDTASQNTIKRQESIHQGFSELLKNKDFARQAFVMKEVLDDPKGFN